MRAKILTVCGLIAAMATTTLRAETKTFEGIWVKAAGSINGPNPQTGCTNAKQDATEKAAKEGFKTLVNWEHLSNDSDCKLRTEGARGVGYYYIFTAKGTFSK